MNDYTSNPFVVAEAAPAVRADFYRRTYLLVATACAVFGLALAGILSMPAIVNPLTRVFFGGGALGWLLVLGGFWLISMLANRLAFGGASAGTQIAGLGIYVVAEALLFAPMLNVLILNFGDATLSEIVAPAAVSTLLLAGGLTATVFMTKTDFSFLRAFVVIGLFVALGVIVCAAIFGASLGMWFVIAMTALMAAVILYQTWAVKTQFRPDQHVGAALVIFSGIATLFWYLIMLFASRRD